MTTNTDRAGEIVREEWRPVAGYDGLYEVSNTGRVRSVTRIVGNGRLIRGQPIQPFKRSGYWSVSLYKNNINRFYLVHRLVAEAFIPNLHQYPLVNHKDENKTNNAVYNLEWCTFKYNVQYGKCTEKISRSKGSPVVQIHKNGQSTLWHSMKEAERKTGVSHQDISRVCRGIRKSAGGFKWKYAI